jgi:hypothetical protein
MPMVSNEGSIEEVDVLGLLNTSLEDGSSPVHHGDVVRQVIELGININAELRTPTPTKKKKKSVLKITYFRI